MLSKDVQIYLMYLMNLTNSKYFNNRLFRYPLIHASRIQLNSETFLRASGLSHPN